MDKDQILVGFTPTKEKDWKLESGKTYRLKYRIITYDGKLSPENAEKLWDEYIHPHCIGR